jgi:hypothetical protein
VEQINSIFNEDLPHRKIINETYAVLSKTLPPVLISAKTIFPDPPIFGKSAILTLKLVNIQTEAVKYKVNPILRRNLKGHYD